LRWECPQQQECRLAARCLAGVGDDGVLTSIVSWVTRPGQGECFLSVSGLYSQTKKHVNWINQRRVSVGDEIRLRIVEASSVDPPIEQEK